MRETRLSGSEGGAAQTNVPSLPLYKKCAKLFSGNGSHVPVELWKSALTIEEANGLGKNKVISGRRPSGASENRQAL